MKVKLDENLPTELLSDLRAAGHDAETVVQEGLSGHSDADILARATEEGRVLFTMDKGIANMRPRDRNRLAARDNERRRRGRPARTAPGCFRAGRSRPLRRNSRRR